MTCDQCEMLSINGLACHETGCPNAKKTWVPDRKSWVQFVACRECGCDIEVGEPCDCMTPEEEQRAWFCTSSGHIEFELALDDAHYGSHQGQCDDDIARLRMVPYIAEQLDKIDPALLAAELKEYGAWDAEELADHDANLSRILWLACGDIVEEEEEEEEFNRD